MLSIPEFLFSSSLYNTTSIVKLCFTKAAKFLTNGFRSSFEIRYELDNRWEVAKSVASEVRVIRCSWFGNITTNEFNQSGDISQPSKAYFMMITSEMEII